MSQHVQKMDHCPAAFRMMHITAHMQSTSLHLWVGFLVFKELLAPCLTPADCLGEVILQLSKGWMES